MITKKSKFKELVLTDLDVERQALILLRNVYSERLLYVNLLIDEIDKRGG